MKNSRIMAINLLKYDSLSPDLQKAIQAAADEALVYGADVVKEKEEAILKQMAAEGIQVTRLTPEQRDVWKKYGKKSWPKFGKVLGKDTMNLILEKAK